MSSENINGIIKSCRDIMRKDKGMNTDAQRIPQLLWMLFLKCFDDFELQKEVLGKHESVIDEPYRWRDWTSNETGKRGEELIEFVNNDLFKYLANLQGETSSDQRDTVADIFREQKNFMTDGYGMKDMIQQINKLDFTSSNQFHLIGTVYEKMLLGMKDDSPGTFGEFYTPRPVIEFIVKIIHPSLKDRETIQDPACGTGGFLIASFNHLEKQVKSTDDNKFLQKNCLFGIEPRPDPYLFCLMNLMLHGQTEPKIVRVNTLETKLSDIQENLQHDIIMTNPPFGGEEQDSIKRKLPGGFQTKDTALGFILHCITRLKDGGRCAIILPDGTPLSGEGIAAKIRKKLIEECDLHTIVRLPRTTFAPYTNYATNILFFNKNGKTKEINYFQMQIRTGLKSYNKTNPISIDDFCDVEKWLVKKGNSKNSWTVKVEDLKNYNLDIKNPISKKENLELSPKSAIKNLIKEQKNLLGLLQKYEKLINSEFSKISNSDYASKCVSTMLGNTFNEIKEKWQPSKKSEIQNFVGLENIESHSGKLVKFKPTKTSEIKSSKSKFKKNHILYGRLRPNLNKVLLPDFDGICSTDILVLEPKKNVTRDFLGYLIRSKKVLAITSKNVEGERPRVKINILKEIPILLPSISEQKKIVSNLKKYDKLMEEFRSKSMNISQNIDELFQYLNNSLIQF